MELSNIQKYKKEFPMPRNMLLIPLSILALAACQTPATPEEQKAITSAYPDSTACYAKAMNKAFLHSCLRDLLDDAEEKMEDINSELIAKARGNDKEEFEKRAAVRDITNSNLAFMTYRHAECTRQASSGQAPQIEDDVFMACELDLTNKRLEKIAIRQ